jgi:RNA polymerase sigma-70 factor (ECF subfamily)
MTGNVTDAEDLFQETWLRVAKNVEGIKNVDSIKNWIYTIATNLHRDFLRKKKVRRAFWERLNSSEPDMDHSDENHVNPMRRREFEESGEAIRIAIEKLAEPLRQVFILKEIEGLRYREIATILKTSSSAVKSRMHRAVMKLRTYLAEWHPDSMDKR